MYNIYKNKYLKVILLLFLLFNISNCEKTRSKTIDEILPEYQWRKTEEAIYSINNEFEDYTYKFEDADDCEKNSFWTFGKYIIDTTHFSSTCHFTNICTDNRLLYNWYLNDKQDSLKLVLDNDTIRDEYTFHIESYSKKELILQFDTTIENSKRIIKETYTAYEK